MTGRIHSVQSLGTVDGPGIRYVIFMQGCNLRCGCCHNPDTWDIQGGNAVDAADVVHKVCNYKSYFAGDGGVTISGGEPLLQAEFCREVFRLCHQNGINTCLDTSGSLLTDEAKLLLEHTDRVLLDIKYASDELYKKHVGCSIQKPLEFLEYLDKKKIPTVLRNVIIPSLNDSRSDMEFLTKLKKSHSCVENIELLPFRKICSVKYENMGISFPFGEFDTPGSDVMEKLNSYLRAE